MLLFKIGNQSTASLAGKRLAGNKRDNRIKKEESGAVVLKSKKLKISKTPKAAYKPTIRYKKYNNIFYILFDYNNPNIVIFRAEIFKSFG